jgi:hypothetical protein
MNKSLAIVVAIAGISCATVSAQAQERLGDGAMGALAGALASPARSAWSQASSSAILPDHQ